MIESAASDAHIMVQARYDARNPGALKQLVAAGTKLRPFSTDLMNVAFKESMALYDDISSKNPDWKKIYADYSKFRQEENLWFQFTEASLDNFLQQQVKAKKL